MIPVLVSLITFIAAGAWIVAFVSLVRVVLMVPAGQRISTIFSAGFWQFEKVRAVTGNRADPHLQRFMWAFVVFFFAIIAGIFVGVASNLMSREAPPPSAALANPPALAVSLES